MFNCIGWKTGKNPDESLVGWNFVGAKTEPRVVSHVIAFF